MIRFLQVLTDEDGANILCGLHPEDWEWLEKQKPGKQIKADLKATRNPDHHRKAFALFNLVKDNHPEYQTIDEVLLEMKIRSGHYVETIRPGNSKVAQELRRAIGQTAAQTNVNHVYAMIDQLEREAKMVFTPKSIAFDSLGQEEFEDLYAKWLAIAGQMLGVADETIRKELAEFA